MNLPVAPVLVAVAVALLLWLWRRAGMNAVMRATAIGEIVLGVGLIYVKGQAFPADPPIIGGAGAIFVLSGLAMFGHLRWDRRKARQDHSGCTP